MHFKSSVSARKILMEKMKSHGNISSDFSFGLGMRGKWGWGGGGWWNYTPEGFHLQAVTLKPSRPHELVVDAFIGYHPCDSAVSFVMMENYS